jgi:hypothetical protein
LFCVNGRHTHTGCSTQFICERRSPPSIRGTGYDRKWISLREEEKITMAITPSCHQAMHFDDP